MNNILRVLNFLTLLIGSLGQLDLATIPGGIVGEIWSLLTNGTVEHFVGCKSADNFTEDDIAYYLYTRDSENRTALTLNNLYELDPTKDLKIIFGGWLQATNDSTMLRLVDAYLTRYDCNVIFVEYINLTNAQYTQAYCNLIKGAEMMGDFFCDMYYEGYLDFNRVHIVGLSLGGEISGLIGKRVQKTCSQTVDRITGCDPAGPIYQYQKPSMRLVKSDANFVDVIHTNAGLFGYWGSIGHVDFFPNCGTAQPGCIDLGNKTDILSTIGTFIGCSHARSIELFTESVYGPVFNSTSCSSCTNSKGIGKCLGGDVINAKHTVMGEDCPRNPPAKRFHLKTNGESPFAITN